MRLKILPRRLAHQRQLLHSSPTPWPRPLSSANHLLPTARWLCRSSIVLSASAHQSAGSSSWRERGPAFLTMRRRLSMLSMSLPKGCGLLRIHLQKLQRWWLLTRMQALLNGYKSKNVVRFSLPPDRTFLLNTVFQKYLRLITVLLNVGYISSLTIYTKLWGKNAITNMITVVILFYLEVSANTSLGWLDGNGWKINFHLVPWIRSICDGCSFLFITVRLCSLSFVYVHVRLYRVHVSL